MKSDQICFKHGRYNGICKKCQKLEHHFLKLEIEKKYEEKFSEEEREKFSILWSYQK